MHLMRAALAHFYDSQKLQDDLQSSRPRLIYFANDDEFPEVADFVGVTSAQYNADLRVYTNTPFAAGLRSCIESEKVQCLAFLLGTRKVGRSVLRNSVGIYEASTCAAGGRLYHMLL